MAMMRWRYLRSSSTWWMGVSVAAVGTLFFFIGVFTWQSSRHFNATAVSTTATVVEKGYSSDSRDRNSYWIRYVYRDEAGTEHRSAAGVTWSVWGRYQNGGPLQIRYAPDRPDKSKLNAGDTPPWWTAPLVWCTAGILFGGAGGLLARRTFIISGQRVELLRHGRSVMAAVTAVETNAGVTINNRHPRYLKYEFVDEAGTKHQGRSVDLPQRMENRWQTGDPILVMYDPRDPSKHDADVFDLKETRGGRQPDTIG
jgi:hypothetical protein